MLKKNILLSLLLVPAMLMFSYAANAVEKKPPKKPANKAEAPPAAKPDPSENECKSSMEPFFTIRPGDKVISNASFTTQHEIVFYPSQTSASRLEWNFGDGQKFVQTKAAGEFTSVPHAYSSFGTYTVTLTAIKSCKESEPRKDVFAQDVTIFDPNILTCNSTAKITENDIKVYRIDALTYWIKSMRNDFAREKGVNMLWENMAKELAGVEKVKGFESRKILAKSIFQNTSQAISRLTGPTGLFGGSAHAPVPVFGQIASHATTSIEASKTKEELKTIIEELQDVKDYAVAQGRAVVDNCEETLATAEFVLRKRGNYILRKIKEETDLKQTTGISAEEVKNIDEKISNMRERVKKIKQTTPLTNDDLFQTFDDYDDYFFRFNAGYEFATVNKLFQKGFPRVGFLVYKQSDRKIVDDFSGGWDLFYGYHLSLAALVTSSAEQETDITSKDQTVKNTGENKALEFDMELFTPIYRSARYNNGKLWLYIGPVVMVGAKKVDVDSTGNTSNKIASRCYGGIKLATNPELYADFLFGKTSSLHSKRLELRGQMPIYRFENGSRFILGAIGNIGVQDKVPDEADDLRVYVTWNVNFDMIYAYFSGKQLNSTLTQ